MVLDSALWNADYGWNCKKLWTPVSGFWKWTVCGHWIVESRFQILELSGIETILEYRTLGGHSRILHSPGMGMDFRIRTLKIDCGIQILESSWRMWLVGCKLWNWLWFWNWVWFQNPAFPQSMLIIHPPLTHSPKSETKTVDYGLWNSNGDSNLGLVLWSWGVHCVF